MRKLFLLSFVFTTLFQVTTKAQNQADNFEILTEAVRQNLLILEDDFSNLPKTLNEQEMIFLGEIHDSVEYLKAQNIFVEHFARTSPVVYAVESVYGAFPFFEAMSMGDASVPHGGNNFLKALGEFNKTSNNKILLTAIDLEHSVYNNKEETTMFLNYLADLSESETSSTKIKVEIAELVNQKTPSEMASYLEKLEKCFLDYDKTFSQADLEEINFSFDLVKASNLYQGAWRGQLEYNGNPKELRSEWFKKTIERAYKKATQREAILVCKVGNTHIAKSYPYSESEYFENNYPQTKGKVWTVHMELLPENIEPDSQGRYTESIVAILSYIRNYMDGNQYAYIDTRSLPKQLIDLIFPQGMPEFDSVLFMKPNLSAKKM